MRRALWLALLLALLALALATAGVGAAPSASKAAAKDPNPCFAPVAANLRCPDLVMRRPYGLRVDRQTRRGRSLLRAGNSIDSLGAGPAELRGRRSGGRFMNAVQSIYTRAGRRLTFRTGARLQFKFAHANRSYWKFYRAASFSLWRLNAAGERTRRVRTGPRLPTACAISRTPGRGWRARPAAAATRPATPTRASGEWCSAPPWAGRTSTRRAIPSSGST